MSRFKSWLVETGRALLPVVWLTVAWLLLFEIFRVILIGATWYLRSDATLALLGEAVLRGLRFDFSVAVKLIAPFAAWRIWRPSPSRVERNVVWVIYAVTAFLSIFALTAEVEFYKEFQMRLGPLVFEYFGRPEHNEIVVSMIWSGYPVIRWMLVCLAIWALFMWIFGRIFLKNTTSYGWQAGSMATVIWVVITVLAFRGGWQSDPLRWGNAFFSQSTYANHMTQNGVFAMIDTIRGLFKKQGKANEPWTKGMATDEAIRMTREMVLLPGETLVDPSTFPLLRRSPPCTMEIKKRPKNVVLVIMESFSARFCGATGASFGATPRYDALAERGFLFDHAFSVGTHTAQGVMGALCSFPSLPGYDALMRETMASQPIRSLPAVLSEKGFQSLFIYNGLLSWDNKEGFFRNHGVQRFIGLPDFKNPTFLDPVWGVSDHDVFLRATEEFNGMAHGGKPFLGIIVTLSNHAPFNLPKVDGLAPITGGGVENQRLNGMHYADWAVGEFMDQAKKQPWFDDTLFVFTGDHGFGVPPVLTEVGILHEHVPILFYGPGVFGDRHEKRHVVAGHMDIVPTILGVLGLDTPHQSFGRDLFSLPPDDKGRAFVRESGGKYIGMIEGNEIAVALPGRPTTLKRLDLGFPPSVSEDLADGEPERAKEMEHRLRSFILTGLKTFEHRLMAEKPR